MPRSVHKAIAALSGLLLALVLSFPVAEPASAQTMTEEQFRAEIAQRREAAAAIDRASNPVAWAVAQTELANGLYAQWDHDSMAEAVTLYRAALEVLTPEATPVEWLAAQEGLGNTLLQTGNNRMLALMLGMRFGGSWADPGVDSRDAASAFRAVLNLRTRDSDRVGWARLQIKLAYALTTWTARQRFAQAESSEIDAIEGEAESAFRQALSSLSLRANPIEWAWANEGLRILYSQAALFYGQEYVEDEAALRRSEARRVRYIRAAIASALEAERAYQRSGDQERAQDSRRQLERLREDLRPSRRRVPDW